MKLTTSQTMSLKNGKEQINNDNRKEPKRVLKKLVYFVLLEKALQNRR